MVENRLLNRYSDIVNELVELSNRFEFLEADTVDNHVKALIFNVMNLRVIRILNEIDCTNAALLMKGLINLTPDKNDSMDELIEHLVDYHKAEKDVIRKYKYKTGYEVKEIKIEKLFKFLIEKLNNKSDKQGIE